MGSGQETPDKQEYRRRHHSRICSCSRCSASCLSSSDSPSTESYANPSSLRSSEVRSRTMAAISAEALRSRPARRRTCVPGPLSQSQTASSSAPGPSETPRVVTTSRILRSRSEGARANGDSRSTRAVQDSGDEPEHQACSEQQCHQRSYSDAPTQEPRVRGREEAWRGPGRAAPSGR